MDLRVQGQDWEDHFSATGDAEIDVEPASTAEIAIGEGMDMIINSLRIMTGQVEIVETPADYNSKKAKK